MNTITTTMTTIMNRINIICLWGDRRGGRGRREAPALALRLRLDTYICYNPAKPSGRGGGPPPGWEGDSLVL